MSWVQLIVAFLAGYGLMSLALCVLNWVRRLWGPSLAVGVLIAAGNEEDRIEGIIREIHGLWEDGRVGEIVVWIEGRDSTRAIADRLSADLPALKVRPEGEDLAAAIKETKSQVVFLVDLARIPGAINTEQMLAPQCRRKSVG